MFKFLLSKRFGLAGKLTDLFDLFDSFYHKKGQFMFYFTGTHTCTLEQHCYQHAIAIHVLIACLLYKFEFYFLFYFYFIAILESVLNSARPYSSTREGTGSMLAATYEQVWPQHTIANKQHRVHVQYTCSTRVRILKQHLRTLCSMLPVLQ